MFCVVTECFVWSLSGPAAGEDVPRRTSKLGFDTTPLTAEQREEAASRLNAFQRCHILPETTQGH